LKNNEQIKQCCSEEYRELLSYLVKASASKRY